MSKKFFNDGGSENINVINPAYIVVAKPTVKILKAVDKREITIIPTLMINKVIITESDKSKL